MFKFIFKVLGIKEKDIHGYPIDFNEFLRREVYRSTYIKTEHRELIYNHITRKIDILKNGTELTKEEKIKLKINTRVKYTTKELISSLTDLGLQEYSFNPKIVLNDLYHSARSKLHNAKELQKIKKSIDAKTAIYRCAGDSDDCDWCLKMEGKKLPVDIDIIKLIEDNCTCSFNRAYMEAVIPR
ncbi:hypothetical protein [Xenorhabdus eapokensis]|uniref:Uncharacterized protein n=1 Tax=Xenorhabdus eapokensis TaxID=1873482 RepID=A0A1Q5TQW8_9GAMM|nr:hypothetical protein [Xenorhabdus eapokensis]OKP02619.1 hypothetical protein Xedl_02270 [Xenorhabdus eapokensis]